MLSVIVQVSALLYGHTNVIANPVARVCSRGDAFFRSNNQLLVLFKSFGFNTQAPAEMFSEGGTISFWKSLEHGY